MGIMRRLKNENKIRINIFLKMVEGKVDEILADLVLHTPIYF